MCLIVVARDVNPEIPLVIAANRDEFHERPTAPADFWPGPGQVLAGRDLLAGGSWLGVTRDGRVAAVTNVREFSDRQFSSSRGQLVIDFLRGGQQPAQFHEDLEPSLDHYGPFNLLVGGPGTDLGLFSNRGSWCALPEGIHGISNEPMVSAWPKVERCKEALGTWLKRNGNLEILFDTLSDRTPAKAPPETGLDSAMEALLSAPFVLSSTYGTRASTVVIFRRSGSCHFEERRFDSRGAPLGHSRFQFDLV